MTRRFEGRAARFALTGLLCAALQLALVGVFEAARLPGMLANAGAFFLAAQLNFALSSRFTWSDRGRSGPLAWRWIAFLGAISGTAVLNMAVFALTRGAVGDVPAAALGIGASALVNFVVGDRAIFRSTPIVGAHTLELRLAERRPKGIVRG